MILPAASGLEKEGNLLYLNGKLRRIDPVLPPPGGAKPDGAIIQGMADDGLTSPGGARLQDALRGEPLPKEELVSRMAALWEEELAQANDGKLPFWLIPSAHPAHLGNGEITAHLGWARKVCPEPFIELNPATAAKLKLEAGEKAVISSEAGKEVLSVGINERLREDQVTVPAHFPQLRRLYPWRVGGVLGEFSLRPPRVRITKAKGD